MLQLAMPEAQIIATPINGLVLLTGTVAAPADAEEAERLVQAFVGDRHTGGQPPETATPQQVMLQGHDRRGQPLARQATSASTSSPAISDGSGFQFGLVAAMPAPSRRCSATR